MIGDDRFDDQQITRTHDRKSEGGADQRYQ